MNYIGDFSMLLKEKSGFIMIKLRKIDEQRKNDSGDLKKIEKEKREMI